MRDFARVAAIGLHNYKFVATQPVETSIASGKLRHPLRHFLQQPVADRMAKGIVDVLEAIEVEYCNRSRTTGQAVTRPDRLVKIVLQAGSISEPGELVVMREMLELFLDDLAFGYIAAGEKVLFLRFRPYARTCQRDDATALVRVARLEIAHFGAAARESHFTPSAFEVAGIDEIDGVVANHLLRRVAENCRRNRADALEISAAVRD